MPEYDGSVLRLAIACLNGKHVSADSLCRLYHMRSPYPERILSVWLVALGGDLPHWGVGPGQQHATHSPNIMHK